MIGLIKKDLLLIKNNLRNVAVVLIIFVFLSIQGTMDLTVIFPMICVMLFISTFSYDEYNKWDAYAITLPNGRKNVVRSKYLATLIMILLSTIVVVILTLIISNNKEGFDFNETLFKTFGGLSALIVLESVMYPLIFKFGIEKGRIGLFVGVVLITTLIGFVMPSIDDSLSVNIINFLNNYGLIVIPIIALLIFVISYFISLKIYMKKEF